MANGNALIFHMRHLMAEHLIDEAHATGHIHPGAIGNGNACTFLTAVLQGIKP